METDLQSVTVNWKCGKCDVMHNETIEIIDSIADRTKVIDLVSLIVLSDDSDNPHLSVICTRDGEPHDETTAVLLTCLMRAVIQD